MTRSIRFLGARERNCVVLILRHIAALALTTTVISAQVQESIAVLNLEGTGISQSEAAGLTDRFRTDLVRTNLVTVVERGQMESILAEQDFQLTGCTSEECAVEIGQLLGVTSMVAGTIGKIGSTYIIDIRMIDVKTGQIRMSLKKDYRGEVDGLIPIITSLADELAGGAGREIAPPTPLERTASISISLEPSGAEVRMEGVEIGVTPISNFEVIADRRNIFSFAQAGYARLDTAISAASGQDFQLHAFLIPVTSWLSIAAIPYDAVVTFNGRTVPRLPVSDQMIPADSSYAISISREGYQSTDTVLYAIRGEHHELHPRLVENSFLTLGTEPSGAQVLIDGLVIGTSPLQQYELLSGEAYTMTVQYPGYRTIDTTVATSVGSRHELSIPMNRITSWLSILGEKESRVTINDQYYGILPLSRIELATGDYDVEIRKPEYYPYTEQLRIEDGIESTIDFSLIRKPKLPALAASMILPGTGQLYQGYRIKGSMMFLSVAGLAYFAAQGEISFRANMESYEADRAKYLAADELGEIEAARINMETSFNSMKKSERSRNTIWGVLVSAWAVNILDVTF